jgi:hypothetical protein
MYQKGLKRPRHHGNTSGCSTKALKREPSCNIARQSRMTAICVIFGGKILSFELEFSNFF